MRIYGLKAMSLPKIAVLATGLAAAIMVATMSPQVAHATPRAASCAGCHGAATAGVTTATPSTAAPAAGASYTVAITLVANPNGGKSGYGITPVTAGTGSTFGGNTGADLSFTATMTAPAAAGTYSYTVWTDQGKTDGTAKVGSAAYSISVEAGSTTPSVTTTSTPPVTTTSAPPVTTTSTTPVVELANVHGPYALDAPQCGFCHRTHTAKAPNLLNAGSPSSSGSQSTLCLNCHNGTGADPAVSIQYALVRPGNNAATREFYSHDAIGATPAIPHTQSATNEFSGVINRHSECADCHNSHQATVTATRDSAQTTTGWDTSRRLAGVSGVSVVNGAAGTAPAYKFLSGVDTNVDPANLVTREYQLCFKCHSGFTRLPPPIAGQPSKDLLDKGVEFNPANPSFHPVEAAGKNNTAAMKASLAGTSPYKLWDLDVTSTIRCLNCHASSTTSGPNPPLTGDQTLPQPGSALQPHTSSNRGILIRPYKDRVLKSRTDAYSAGDFALCYVCHAEAPFAPNGSTTATNFKYHALHLNELTDKTYGPTASTDIDTANDGVGNAICAECHFRLHSTANKVGAQTLTGDPVTGSRLVNFAPNVTAFGATPVSWETTSTGSGSCTLTCHGEDHDGYTYGP